MKQISSIFIFLCCLTTLAAQDTFSIVAVDPETGEVGSAGATCVPGIGDFGGVILLSGIIPGRGGVNAQAYICLNPHVNLVNGVARLGEGFSPQEVIDWLEENDACSSQNFNPAYRQYGVAALDENGQASAAAFTGQNADDWKGHRTGDTYAIQGNILRGPEVVDGMEQAFNDTEGSLAERLMAAMQGANMVGADARCTEAGTSSTSAFLRVFKPGDDPNDPYLELNVAEAPSGVEPIDSLQALFDEWALTDSRGELVPSQPSFRAYPNPVRDALQLEVKYAKGADLQLCWYNTAGQLVKTDALTEGSSTVVNPVREGLYWLCLQDTDGRVWQRERLVVVN
jgi:uncharacterized Ntn-hydrolase superfamily protein